MKLRTYLLNIVVGLTIIPGCKKLVEVDPPVSQLVTSNVFDNDNTVTAAQLSIYAQMQNVPLLFHRVTALSSDEFKNYATDITSKDLYANALNATTDAGAINVWSRAYNFIYQVNAILEGIQGNNNISKKVRQQTAGEAEFVRAYWYFYLVNLYGDVPLITSTSYTENSVKARTAKADVYKQIVLDLKKAQNDLSPIFLDATDTVGTDERIRPTTWAATALLARTYLYLGQYDSAIENSSKVINHTELFNLPTDLTQVFLANSPEAIWQITPASSDHYTPEGANFILNTPPKTGTGNSAEISSQLMNAFEANDQRKANWIQSFTKGTNTWYFPYKYRANKTSTTLTEYTMVLRLAEQYLIRAEAYAQLDKNDNAVNDLNAIRNRALLGPYQGLTDKASLLTAIAHERQVELFTEGDRWFNLKRTGTIDLVMDSVTQSKGGQWNTYQQLYPIPVGDIQKNDNIKQNTGYF